MLKNWHYANNLAYSGLPSRGARLISRGILQPGGCPRVRGRLPSAAGRPPVADHALRQPGDPPHAPWRRGISRDSRHGTMRARDGLSRESSLQIATAGPGSLQATRHHPDLGLINCVELRYAALPLLPYRHFKAHPKPPCGTAWNGGRWSRTSLIELATRRRQPADGEGPSGFWHVSWMGYTSQEADTWAHLPRDGRGGPAVGERVAAAGAGGPPSRRGGPCDPDCAPSSWGPRSCWRP